ncbi:MAG: glycosyltransferase [Thermodesulfobacteriota bacterium]|jgi:glycosyltransferase involved in cell wall biosynthesis
MAKVSICIPSYNAGRFIGETIKSVLDSVYQDFEIIVNDDASTDNTREVVHSFQDSRIRFYQNDKNVGTVQNWNLAIKKACGEYAGLLNHDDLYGPFWLTFAVHQLEKHPHICWVATAHRIIDENGKTLDGVSRFPKTGEINRTEAFLEIAKQYGLGPGFIARRRVLDEIGYYDEEVGPSADNDLFLRLAARYPLFYCANYPHTAWRLHQSNLTHRWGPIEQTTEGIRILNKNFDNHTLPQELQQYRDSCLSYYLRKSKTYADQFFDVNDQNTYNKIIHILKLNGYTDSES